MSEISFRDRVAVVTGAGGGLGRTYALELAKRGASVVVNDLGGAADGTGAASSAADNVVKEITEAGGVAVANYDSVATPEGGAAIIQTALDNFSKVDVVINNAGILRDKSFSKLSPEELEIVIDVHLKGAFFVSQPAFRVMKEQGYGRFLFTASAAGVFGNFGQSNYGAAKMGLVGLMNVLAVEGAKNNIKANTIMPIANTRLTKDLLGPDRGQARPDGHYAARDLSRERGLRAHARALHRRWRSLCACLHRHGGGLGARHRGRGQRGRHCGQPRHDSRSGGLHRAGQHRRRDEDHRVWPQRLIARDGSRLDPSARRREARVRSARASFAYGARAGVPHRGGCPLR